jgi:ABC-type glycerol-3-phosphate transport system substrate-binding protein
MMHKRSFLLSLLLIASLILAACGPGAANTTPTAAVPGTGDDQLPPPDVVAEDLEPDPVEVTGPITALPDDCGTVQLTYWNPFTGPDGPFMGQMVDAFNDEHPNIQVTMNSQGDYYTQLTTAAASAPCLMWPLSTRIRWRHRLSAMCCAQSTAWLNRWQFLGRRFPRGRVGRW